MSTHADVGGSGETLAGAYLRQAKGYEIVAHNWRNPQDRREEIDLIALDGDVLIFVEVKTRSGGARVPGFYAVNRAKRKVLRRAARTYLRLLPFRPHTYRLDVVEIELGSGDPEVRHYINVGLFPSKYGA
ncbi:MAG TPA: YraN family protein [Opitutaceae bacterium]|jgi:putative endonuclease